MRRLARHNLAESSLARFRAASKRSGPSFNECGRTPSRTERPSPVAPKPFQTTSHPRSLLSIARSNIARSRSRRSRFSQNLMAQTCCAFQAVAEQRILLTYIILDEVAGPQDCRRCLTSGSLAKLPSCRSNWPFIRGISDKTGVDIIKDRPCGTTRGSRVL
jgi:hypothetical protein